jgi:DNA-binding NarL/FixJ family response regulator
MPPAVGYFVSVNTISTHVRSIYAELQVRERFLGGAARQGAAAAGGRPHALARRQITGIR